MAQAQAAPKAGFFGRYSQMGRTERRNLWLGLAFVSPWIFGFLAFFVYPFFYTFRIGFTRYSGFQDPEWIGLENYRDLHRVPINSGKRSTTPSTTRLSLSRSAPPSR